MLKTSLTFKNLKKTKPKATQTAPQIKNLPSDWVEFASSCKIRSGQGIVYFKPYEYQKKLIEIIRDNPTTVIAKTRQLGITETIANYFLFKAYHNEGYLAVIFSKTQADTSNIAKRLRRQIESLDLITKTDSLTDIELVEGGRVLFRNSTPNGARGLESVSDILYDEASFVDDIEEIYKSSIPCTTCVGDAARIIINSTPNGQNGWYWDKLTQNNFDIDVIAASQAITDKEADPFYKWEDRNGWAKILLHWLAHPEFSKKADSYLLDIKKRFELSDEIIQQEYNLSFTHTDTSVFDMNLVRKAAVGNLESPTSEGIYYMGIDTSLMGNDYTVCVVLKQIKERFSLVSLYRQRKQTHDYHIYHLTNIIQLYQPLNVVIETNSSGQIYYEKLTESLPQFNIEGHRTTQTSKINLITKLTLYLEQFKLIFPDNKDIVSEFLNFKRVDNTYQASQGKHDDIIIALGLSLIALG